MSGKRKLNKSKILEYLNIVAPILPAPIYWEDKNSKVLGVNQHILAGIGVSEDIVGKTIYDFHPYEIAHHIVEHNKEVMETGKILSQEEKVHHISTGETRWFTAIKAPLRDEDGTVIGIIGTSIDITDQKKAERQLRIEKEKAEAASQAKADFISSISHEFRTPMNAMLGITQLLLLTASDEATKEKLNEIMRAGEHLLGLITDILDYSKLEAEKFELNQKPFSLKKHFTQTINQLSHLLEHRADLCLDAYFDETIPEYVIGDEKCLRQVLFNLGGNAIKFTKKGSVKAKVFLVQQTAAKIKVRIELIDTGTGIPKKKLGIIFDRFTQADSSYNRQYGGTGLGLAITKKLIDRMGGAVGVESEVNKGSRFWCELEFKIATAKQIHDAQEAEKTAWDGAMLTKMQNPPAPLTPVPVEAVVASTCTSTLLVNKHVVMVEDDRLNQLVLNGMLENLGAKPMVFADAGSTLTYLTQNTTPVDIILTDIGLPDMNGVELMKKIRQNSCYQHCPMIAVTGFSGKDEIQRFLSEGANAVLNKPISFAGLKACIEQYLPAHAAPAMAPAAVSETDLTVFDYQQSLAQLCDNTELLKELLTILSGELPHYKQSIDDSIRASDAVRLAAVTHKLEGGISMLHMQRLQHATSTTNKAIREQGFNPQVETLAQGLLAEIDRLDQALKTHAG